MSQCDNYILNQEEPTRSILRHLHHLLELFPEMTCKIRYRIPFYYCKSWICYLNPLSGNRVELAFTKAYALSNEQGLLHFRGRKQVAGIIFTSVNDIPNEQLLELIAEALLLDKELG